MTEAVGSLRANLTADWADFRSELQRSGQALGQFGNQFNGIAGAITRQAAGLFAGFQVGQFIANSVQATIAFHQLEGAFNAAFGDNAQAARAWADQLATSLNRPQSEILDLADKFQNLFGEISPTADAAAEASERFTQLALDFAALKDIPVDQALQLLQQGLAGSARGLRQYGIDLTDANVKQVAIREGIINSNQELSSQQAYLVRAAILQRALAAATGEAARQVGDAANSQEHLRAQFEQSQHALGDALIPAMTALANAASWALKAFNDLFAGIGRNLANNETFVGFFAQLGNVLTGSRHSYAQVEAAVHSTIEEQRRGVPVQHAQAAATQAQTQASNDYAASLLAQARGLHNATTTGHERGKTLQETLQLLERERTSLALTTDQRNVETETLNRLNQLRATYDRTIDGEPARQIRAAVAINANIERFNQLRDALDPVATAQREYHLDLDALRTALDQGRISQDEYNQAVQRVEFRYRNALDAQQTFLNAQQRERDLSALTNDQRAIEEQVIQELDRRQLDYATNKDGPVANAIRDEITHTQELIRVHRAAQAVYDEFVAPTQRYHDALQGISEAAAQYGLTDGQVLRAQLEAELAAIQNNTDAASGYRRALIQLQLQGMDAAHSTEQAFTQSFNGLKDTLADVAAGTRDAGDAFRQYLLQVLRAQFIKPFLDSIFNDLLSSLRGQTVGGGGGGGFLGGVLNFVGGLFGGHRAGGGSVVPGMAYEVGEKGRELFVPDQAGQIVPHDKLNAGGRNVTFNVYTPDANSFRNSRRQLARLERRQIGAE